MAGPKRKQPLYKQPQVYDKSFKVRHVLQKRESGQNLKAGIGGRVFTSLTKELKRGAIPRRRSERSRATALL